MATSKTSIVECGPRGLSSESCCGGACGTAKLFDLSGKKALITGATGAIGAAIAKLLAKQGALVGLSGTREPQLQLLADEIGQSASIFPADLAKEGGAEELAKIASSTLGGVDILVNNAGITRDQLAMRTKKKDWEDVLNVDLTAPFLLTSALLRDMVRKRWGRIISISSVVAATGSPGQSNYAAAKAGMIGMTKSIAHEVAGRGITANCVAPGFIESDMTVGLPEARRNAILQAIPMGRYGRPEDVAACVLFLASEEAAYVTGATIPVNGGLVMTS